MKINYTNIVKNIMLLVILLVPFFYLTQVKADAGWDTGYDSGGGYGYGGGYDGDYSSSSGGGSGIGLVFLGIIALVAIIVKFIYDTLTDIHTTILDSNDRAYSDISEDKLHAIFPEKNVEELKQLLFNKYLEIQKACTSLNEDKLKALCDEEINLVYLDRVSEFKKKNLMNIKCDFEIQKLNLVGVKKENNEIIASIFLKVEYLDYVMNAKSKEVISGSNSKKVTNSYVINFVYVNDEFILRNERNVNK